MRAFCLALLTTNLALLCGCETAPTTLTNLPNELSIVEPEAPVAPVSDIVVLQEQDDCATRYLVRADGSEICLDDLLPAILGDIPKDNDNDGIPNISDEDIDGDGIPNGYDLDTDGDGLPNITDDDIDDDGVLNEDDVDVDGDFLRNRWDIDIDGDLLINPRDNDADGDGKFKAIEIVNFECGPVDLFNDPEACGAAQGCDSDDDNESDADGSADSDTTSDSQEDECGDKGKTIRARPGSEGRNAPMVDIIDAELVDANDPILDEISDTEFDILEADIISVLGESDSSLADLEDVEPDSSRSDRADSVVAQLEAAIDPESEDEGGILRDSLSDADLMAWGERRDSVIRLAELPEIDLELADDLTSRLAAAVEGLNAQLLEMIEVTESVDASFTDTAPRADAATAVDFVATAEPNELAVNDVIPAIAPTARALSTIGNQETAESVWLIVVEQATAFRNDDDTFDFSLVAIAQVVDRLASLLDDPDLMAVNDAVGTLLRATSDNDIADPRIVLDRLVERADNDPGISIADGISAEEANDAAEDVVMNP